jgi:hypothetical protein
LKRRYGRSLYVAYYMLMNEGIVMDYSIKVLVKSLINS